MTGGDKFRQAIADIVKRATNADVVQVGFMEDSTYPDGTSVPMVAAINEYGAPARGIPPRPFMRNTVTAHSREWGGDLEKILKAKDYDAAAALDLMGQRIAEQVQESILTFTDPKNADSTIAKKGFDAPLRDTMNMTRSVTSRVVEK